MNDLKNDKFLRNHFNWLGENLVEKYRIAIYIGIINNFITYEEIWVKFKSHDHITPDMIIKPSILVFEDIKMRLQNCDITSGKDLSHFPMIYLESKSKFKEMCEILNITNQSDNLADKLLKSDKLPVDSMNDCFVEGWRKRWLF